MSESRTTGTDNLIENLRSASAYPHPVDEVELITTHISWVLLAGEMAYKIKRPVDLGFLDFSTLEQRRHFCREELRLNRRLAPDLYRDVVPITGTPERPTVGGSGKPIEWAVRMTRFPDEDRLDRLLESGNLHATDMETLAVMVAAFHARTDRAPPDSSFGTPDLVITEARDNFAALAPRLQGATLEDLRQVEAWQQEESDTLREALGARLRQGFVRECHGDLHLSNLIEVDGRFTAFDCIEFAPQLRWVDVIDEAAFLMMDLLTRERRDLAYDFLNAYLEKTGDYEGLALTRFYLAYRSLVRAKVGVLRLDDPDLTDGERHALAARVTAHVGLAERIVRRRRPLVVLMHGVSGSGKSVLAARIGERLPGVRVRSDVERKRLAGMTARDEAGAQPDMGLYSPPSTERTYTRMGEIVATIAGAGFDVIVDAAFLRFSQRDSVRKLADRLGARALIVDCHAPDEELRSRVTSRKSRRDDPSDADEAVLAHQLRSREALTDAERDIAIHVDTCAELNLTDLVSAIAANRDK